VEKKREIILIVIITILLISSLGIYFIFIDETLPYDDAVTVGMLDSGLPYSYVDETTVMKSFVTVENGFDHNEDVYDLNGHGGQVYNTLINTLSDWRQVKIVSAKVIDVNGFGHFGGLFEAVEWINTQDVDVLVFSGGAPNRFEFTNMALLKNTVIGGAAVVMAAGNSGNYNYTHGSVSYPASSPWTLSVGALNTIGERAYYSAVGKSELGLYAVDLVEEGLYLDENGDYGSEFGTSFAAPRTAAKIAEILYWMKKRGNTPSPSDLYALALKSTGQDFSPDVGFGTPNIDRMKELAPTPFSVIKSGNEFEFNERYTRYVGEAWSDSWVMYSYFEEATEIIYIPASVIIESQQVKIPISSLINMTLTRLDPAININIITNYYVGTGNNYTDIIPILSTTPFDWKLPTYFYPDSPKGRVLIDYSGLNDLAYHEYGILTNSIIETRDAGYIVDFSTRDISDLNLNLYDVIYSPQFEDKWFVGWENDTFLTYSYFHPDAIPSLLEYVADGGFWLTSLGYNPYFEYDPPGAFKYLSFYESLNVSVRVTPTRLMGQEAFLTGTNTSYSHRGMSVTPIGENTKTLFEIVHPALGNLSVGIEGTYKNGIFAIIGDTTPFTSENQPNLLKAIISHFEHFYSQA